MKRICRLKFSVVLALITLSLFACSKTTDFIIQDMNMNPVKIDGVHSEQFGSMFRGKYYLMSTYDSFEIHSYNFDSRITKIIASEKIPGKVVSCRIEGINPNLGYLNTHDTKSTTDYHIALLCVNDKKEKSLLYFKANNIEYDMDKISIDLLFSVKVNQENIVRIDVAKDTRIICKKGNVFSYYDQKGENYFLYDVKHDCKLSYDGRYAIRPEGICRISYQYNSVYFDQIYSFKEFVDLTKCYFEENILSLSPYPCYTLSIEDEIIHITDDDYYMKAYRDYYKKRYVKDEVDYLVLDNNLKVDRVTNILTNKLIQTEEGLVYRNPYYNFLGIGNITKKVIDGRFELFYHDRYGTVTEESWIVGEKIGELYQLYLIWEGSSEIRVAKLSPIVNKPLLVLSWPLYFVYTENEGFSFEMHDIVKKGDYISIPYKK